MENNAFTGKNAEMKPSTAMKDTCEVVYCYSSGNAAFLKINSFANVVGESLIRFQLTTFKSTYCLETRILLISVLIQFL